MSRLTFMFSNPGCIRADVAMTEDKTYYRFATEDSIEEGELPGLKQEFESFKNQLLESFRPESGITEDVSPLRFTLFDNNSIVRPIILNHNTLRTFLVRLAGKYNEFSCLHSF